MLSGLSASGKATGRGGFDGICVGRAPAFDKVPSEHEGSHWLFLCAPCLGPPATRRAGANEGLPSPWMPLLRMLLSDTSWPR